MKKFLMKLLYPLWIPDVKDMMQFSSYENIFINFGITTINGKERFLLRKLSYFFGFTLVIIDGKIKLIHLSKKSTWTGNAGRTSVINISTLGFRKESFPKVLQIKPAVDPFDYKFYDIFGNIKYSALEVSRVKESYYVDEYENISKKS